MGVIFPSRSELLRMLVRDYLKNIIENSNQVKKHESDLLNTDKNVIHIRAGTDPEGNPTYRILHLSPKNKERELPVLKPINKNLD